MSYIDQFVASVSFDTKKVIQFRKQDTWKTILYILVFIIVTGAIRAFLTWDTSLELLSTQKSASTDFSIGEIRLTHLFTQYLIVLFDLILHFILISMIAFLGRRGYKTIRDISYRECFTVTAYGISAPILVRLVIQGMGLELPIMTFAYWGAIIIFSSLCLKLIVHLEK